MVRASAVLTVMVVFALFLTLTWPSVSLETKFVKSRSEFYVDNSDRAVAVVTVLNDGGMIPDGGMIAPECCIRLDTRGEFGCFHGGQSVKPCVTPVCGKAKSQGGFSDEVTLTLRRPLQGNLNVTVQAECSFGFMPLMKAVEVHSCVLNEDGYSYSC